MAIPFTGDGWDPSPGARSLHRTVHVGGPILIADNLGGDEFSALAPRDTSASVEQWESLGFGVARRAGRRLQHRRRRAAHTCGRRAGG